MPRRDQIRRPRSPVARWARRILGMAGTAVVLGVGVATASMVVGADDDEVVSQAPAATPTPEPVAPKSQKPSKPRLSAREREQRRRAADQVRREGYAPVRLEDYEPDRVLRVLIGRPVGTTPKGQHAFFFVRDEYIGQDTTSASLKLRLGRRREREITLVYSLYEEGDRECCPTGDDVRVRFRWTGELLEPRDAIPPDYQRLPSTFVQ
jgi:LppP/LprE lipoprotein